MHVGQYAKRKKRTNSNMIFHVRKRCWLAKFFSPWMSDATVVTASVAVMAISKSAVVGADGSSTRIEGGVGQLIPGFM
jgi:hypothetical protein